MSTAEQRLSACVLVVMACTSFWLASNRTFDADYVQGGSNVVWTGDFYRQQALSVLDGRLDVPFEGYSFTECFFRDDRCFGYFGLAPSIVRIAGFAVTNSTLTNPSPVIISAAVTVALWAAVYLALGVATTHSLQRSSRLWLILMVGGILGLGGILVYLSQAKLYYEAITLMIAGLMVSIAFFQRWIVQRRPRLLVPLLMGAVVAAHSRPTAMIPTVILGIGVLFIAYRRPSTKPLADYSLGGAITAIPAMTAVGVMWLKVRAFSPPWELYTMYNTEGLQNVIRANEGELQSIRFSPTILFNYLRPDSLMTLEGWPWLQHAVDRARPPVLLPPITPGGMYVELAASLPNVMPVALVLTLGFTLMALAGAIAFTRQEAEAFVILALASVTTAAGVLTTWSLTTRYLGDFYPFLAVGTAFALVWLLKSAEDGRVVCRVALVCIALSIPVTFIINQALQQDAFNNLLG